MIADITDKHHAQFDPHEIAWDDEKIRRIWDFYGSSPAKDTVYFGATVGSHVARTVRRLGLLKNAKAIVDFSCGKGHLIEHLSSYLQPTSEIIGYDPSDKSVTDANKRNNNLPNFGGAFYLSKLPSGIESTYADLVLLTEVVEHLDDKYLEAILNECYRIMRPGGMLFITTPNNEQLDRETTMCPECGCIFHRWQHVRRWTPIQLKKTLMIYGFKVVKTKKITWGNEWIDIVFTILSRQKTGMYVIALRP